LKDIKREIKALSESNHRNLFENEIIPDEKYFIKLARRLAAKMHIDDGTLTVTKDSLIFKELGFDEKISFNI
jgi:hypothetical protein